MNELPGGMLSAIKAHCPTRLPGTAEKAGDFGIGPMDMALKAVDSDEGLLIFKVSRAGELDRERERVKLHALKSATYELVRNIGLGKIEVDINHGSDAIKCDVLMAWLGAPMVDENACYVALRPHDRSIVDSAKAGHVVGASWSGPYRLKDAV